MPTFVVGGTFSAIWDLHYAEIYCTHSGFHIGRFIVQMMIHTVVIDTLFYWYHRISHIRTPFDVYKHVHSYHHQFNPVTSYAASAQHPIEAVVVTVIHFSDAILFSRIFPLDPMSHQIAGLATLLYGLISHDGTFGADHKTHHNTVNYNYAGGWWKFWDVTCNTYKAPSKRKSYILAAKKKKMM